jgi:hypothetical protein
MSKAKKQADAPAVDPTSPPVELTVNGSTYMLTFDFKSLSEAEFAFNRAGQHVNILVALPELNLFAVRTIWPCALHRHHPGISFEDAQAMIDHDTVFPIATAIANVWTKSLPEPKPNPPAAAAEAG